MSGNSRKELGGIEGKSVPRVWVTLEQKIQIKDYEPVSVQAGMAIDVEEGQSIQEAFRNAFTETKKAIKPEIDKINVVKQRKRI